MTSALIIQPDESDPPERMGKWLEDHGIEIRVIRPYAGDPVPRALNEDALIVLGGDMGVDDDADHPWLNEIKDLLRACVAGYVPTLGVCLGGQLLASCLGGRVERGGAGMEAGTVMVMARTEADSDPLFGSLQGPIRMMTMHRDAIAELPPDAVWLADSKPYPHQAFRVGNHAWGVQFHPEISPATYRYWADFSTDEGEARQRVIDGILEVERHDDEVIIGAAAFTKAFADIVRSQAATRGVRSK